MKFVLFVEGYTEKNVLGPFLSSWLNSRLERKVGIRTVRFDGWPQVVRGMQRKAELYLEGPNSEDLIAIITLLDLYGPDFYPTTASSVDERIQWAKEHFEPKVNSNKFRMFFAVHEIEAWLLSQHGLFPSQVQKALPKKNPEDVNFDNPPSKHFNNIYQQKLSRTYRKITDGKNLFAKLDPDVAYGKCPHLKQMLDEMLRMAQQSGV